MRTHRLGLIQTPDQLRFSYIAILHGADRVLKGDEDEEGEDSLSDEGVATEDSGEEDEGIGKKRKAEENELPPPLPPRHSDSKKPRVEDNITQDDKQTTPPRPLKRTVSLSGSSKSGSSKSVTPEPPPPIPARDDIPPPIPPRDKNMYDDHFLGEREGNPSVKDIPSQNAENSTPMETTPNR